jgi:hypothetical protein
MKKIAFLPVAFDDFNRWATEDKKVHARVDRPGGSGRLARDRAATELEAVRPLAAHRK